jgi:hypothetical protein
VDLRTAEALGLTREPSPQLAGTQATAGLPALRFEHHLDQLPPSEHEAITLQKKNWSLWG